jgi:hypothetical protein
MKKNSARRISFVTGINENYFLLCCMLMESLDRHFPLVPLHVMDFGLSDAQREFLRVKGMLLPMPAGLSRNDHPYKLKGAMRDFLGDRFEAPVWIDADIFALRDGTDELRARWNEMWAGGRRVAVTTCHGRPDGVAETMGFVTGAQPMPHLRAFVDANPMLAQRLYVNAALIMFRETGVISGWRAATDAYEGDACWEQNALNAILAPDLVDALMLDARIWNMHSALIDQMTGGPEDLRCGGERTIFAHATSGIVGHMEEGQMDLQLGGYSFRGFLRFFNHAALRERQMDYLTAFLGNHLDLLSGLGIAGRP